MGMRTAPYIAQRVSNAIRYVHEQMSYFLLNYVDDFLGAETKQKIWEAFNHLKNLLEQLRIDAAPEKMVPPTTRLEFLGVTFDADKGTMEVSPDRLEEMSQELATWLYKTRTTRTELESLIGKLQFISKCVRAGRVFVARLINWLKTMNRRSTYQIDIEARKDIAWWARFLTQYNGVSLLWLFNIPGQDTAISSDACPQGFGAICGHKYLHGFFPQEWSNTNIAYLEIRAVIVALNCFAKELQGKYFRINVDNEAVAHIINSGAGKDSFLQDALREIAMIAASHQFIVKAKHIMGVDNRVPDWLSRWGSREARQKFNQFAQGKDLTEVQAPLDVLEFRHKW